MTLTEQVKILDDKIKKQIKLNMILTDKQLK